MHIQGVFLAIVCLLAGSARAQDTVDTLLSPPQPPPQPVLPPPGPPAPGAAPAEPCPYDPQFTAADCPNQSCWAAPPNGCGSSSLTVISEEIVPDQWPAGVDFNEACDVHDMCYYTPGTQKNECDNEFHEALLAECRESLQCTDLPVVGEQCFENPSENPLFGPCQGLADLYFNAVQQVAEDAFTRGQEEAIQHADQCRQAAAQRAG
ncbi:hypothetical protein Ndes2526B_g00915 [Nannochloris sp. 'desiccata']|nr:hypothetical protein KSW81_002255 [Chlorella desiccata (nom. nud.)]KAH7623682.1 hypothetical protein NADE_008505 [Chlorella desiccata (nom. nud.)]